MTLSGASMIPALSAGDDGAERRVGAIVHKGVSERGTVAAEYRALSR